MKTLLIATAISLSSVTAMAAPMDMGSMSVKEALAAKDDTFGILQGTLVKSLGDEKYEFQDSTGTMTVEIDNDLRQHVQLQANQQVILIGEIEREFRGNEFDVDRIETKTAPVTQ
jgi:uncharacterized protein (TIGR00156 family)